jgi:hypothetical protein
MVNSISIHTHCNSFFTKIIKSRFKIEKKIQNQRRCGFPLVNSGLILGFEWSGWWFFAFLNCLGGSLVRLGGGN